MAIFQTSPYNLPRNKELANPSNVHFIIDQQYYIVQYNQPIALQLLHNTEEQQLIEAHLI